MTFLRGSPYPVVYRGAGAGTGPDPRPRRLRAGCRTARARRTTSRRSSTSATRPRPRPARSALRRSTTRRPAATKESLQKQLDTCVQKKEDPVRARRKKAMEICTYGGRTHIQAGKYNYRGHLRQALGAGAHVQAARRGRRRLPQGLHQRSESARRSPTTSWTTAIARCMRPAPPSRLR